MKLNDVIGSVARKYEKFADVFSYVMISFCVLVFAVMIFSVTYGVLGRYISFIKSPRWTQELAILALVWLCFVSAGFAVKNGLHVRMTVINGIVPKAVAKWLHFASYLLLLFVNGFWIYYGMKLSIMMANARMAATGWPMSLTYVSIVVGGVYGFLMAVGRLLKGGF